MSTGIKSLLACFVMALAAFAADSRLIDAVKNQDHEVLRTLLKERIDVNSPQADGATALSWASYMDDLEAVDLLIRAGAKVDLANQYGITPLLLACTNRSASMVEKLLEAGANPNLAQWEGQTPLMECARTGNVAAVKLLLNHKVNVNAREAGRGQTALMWAAAGKHADVVQTLIEHGTDRNARTGTGFTPLMFAAQQGDLESARILVASGADFKAVVPKYGSVLTIASASRSEAVALFLLDKGADPNVADADGIAPLHYAVARGIADITSIAPTAAFDPYYKVRPSNMPGLAKALLAHGADPNARIKKVFMTFGTTVGLHGEGAPSMVGATPFFLAALSADVELMRMLLAAGADPKLSTLGNSTSLIVAAGGVFDAFRTEEEKRRAFEAVKLVVELGADVNEPNAAGQTPIHAAAFTGATAIVQFLAEKGAKVNVSARNGETPWSMASGISPNAMNAAFWTVHKDTVDLLLKLGATPMPAEDIEALKRNELRRGGGDGGYGVIRPARTQ